ncbi:hypothetical protein [Paenibacillus sp. MER TA 81-3]|uniref:hypothetical protein n=1 Tax=Paenibacillus sp. MER TA 81-3 TaxID=2939573 RepID=UPI00203CF776|nr:hypothetical protein [Paenibacillus sp. MER TA 81-3]
MNYWSFRVTAEYKLTDVDQKWCSLAKETILSLSDGNRSSSWIRFSYQENKKREIEKWHDSTASLHHT